MGNVLDPIKCSRSHPSEEILEEYVLLRLPQTLAVQIEEHLLICPSCQDAAGATEQFVSALRAAVRYPNVAPYPAPDWSPIRSRGRRVARAFGRLASSPMLAPVLLLAILGLLVILRHPHTPLEPVAVSLSSLRGLDPQSQVPSGKPLQLKIEAPDLSLGKEYRVEVVDTAGGVVWKGAVMPTDGKLAATMPQPLGNGMYWVRLYGANSELLREFGLSAK